MASNAQIHPNQVVTLAGPIAVAAGQETRGQFVFDFSDQFSIMAYDSANYCWLEGMVVQFILNP